MLIDALGWNYIKDSPFLKDICPRRQKVRSILGYSCGVIPSILTGKLPSEHGKLALFYYSPKTSPFRWTKYILWLPDMVLENRVTRKIVEIISKNVFGYKGYFETYLVPIRLLRYFDLPERTNAYNEGAFEKYQSVFDVWKEQGISYRRYYYNMKDSEIFDSAFNDISRGRISQICDNLSKISDNLCNKNNLFLYLSEFDHFLHYNCKDQEKISSKLAWYEDNIRSLYKTALLHYDTVNLCVFSDHGMSPVSNCIDIKSKIESLGLEIGKDYIALYDSTMARFYYFNEESSKTIRGILEKIDSGRLYSKNDLTNLGANFKDGLYGQDIFIMNPGTIILPSYMGTKKLEGMHGYDPKDEWMDACFLSNFDPGVELRDVRDFFRVMTNTQINTDSKKQISADYVNRKPSTINRKIKVLYFLNSIVRAGVEEHVLQLIEKIDKNQFEPILVCPQRLIDLIKDDLARIGVKHYPVCIRRWRYFGEIRKFLKILRNEKPDIVHSHLFFATMFAAPISKIAGVPTVIETAHLREAWRKGFKRMFWIDCLIYRYVDKIIAVSHAVKKYLVNEKKLSTDKIEVIHNGVDLEKFKPREQFEQFQHFEHSNNKKPFTIGVIGRLEPQKGHKYFLEAIKMLNGAHKNAKFLIIGEGSLKEDLACRVEQLAICDKVEFLGFRNDIPKLMNQIDLIVLPSIYEGLPLVALEAQAMGKPMVATNVDGTPEVVINHKTGIVVPPKDSKALKEAIELFLDDKNLVVQMGQAARTHIEKMFDLRKQINNTEELYRMLTGSLVYELANSRANSLNALTREPVNAQTQSKTWIQ